MKVITAPDTTSVHIDRWDILLFLGGGISSCPHWRDPLIEKLNKTFSGVDSLIVLNPYRKVYPKDDTDAVKEQIKWEYSFLNRADIITFWFPKESICPITLYELGLYANATNNAKIIVGCDPEYSRLIDVTTQMELERPSLPIYLDLERFMEEVVYKCYRSLIKNVRKKEAYYENTNMDGHEEN